MELHFLGFQGKISSTEQHFWPTKYISSVKQHFSEKNSNLLIMITMSKQHFLKSKQQFSRNCKNILDIEFSLHLIGLHRCCQKTAVLSQPTFCDMESRIQNPKNNFLWHRNPESRIQKQLFVTSSVQNPESRILESRIQNPKSGIQNPESRVSNPESRIQNPWKQSNLFLTTPSPTGRP